MIGWSWKIGRVAGIDVQYMDGTLLTLRAWVGVRHDLQRHHVADAGPGAPR